MLISGVWHGANWTFILWGAIHGLFLCINNLKRKFWGTSNKKYMKGVEVFSTFIMVMFCWIFFRANNLGDAVMAINKIFNHLGSLYKGAGYPSIVLPIILIFLLVVKEVKDEYFAKPILFMHNNNQIISITSTALMIVIILLCGQFEGGQFIYFQF